MREWEASISVLCYTSASHPFKEAASIGVPWYTNASSILICHVIRLVSIFRLFVISSLIFVRLLGGLSQLSLFFFFFFFFFSFFFQISYSRKARDVQFPMVLASFNLELWSLRYCTRKGGDAKLKNSERLPLKNSYLLIRS